MCKPIESENCAGAAIGVQTAWRVAERQIIAQKESPHDQDSPAKNHRNNGTVKSVLFEAQRDDRVAHFHPLEQVQTMLISSRSRTRRVICGMSMGARGPATVTLQQVEARHGSC